MANPLKILGGAAALGGVLALKGLIIHGYLKRREAKLKMLRSNRLQFSKLPRVKQRAVLYYRRGQLADIQNIYAKGYTRKGFGSPRKRSWF